MQGNADQVGTVQRFEIASLDDARDIGIALEKRDDRSIWEAARKASSQGAFFEHLRSQVGFTTYSGVVRQIARTRLEYYCSMILVPVLLPAEASGLVMNTEALKPAIKQVRHWLQEWFEHKVEITLFSAPIGYQEVCGWTPSLMREKLDHLTKRHELRIEAPPDFDFRLPEESPSLAFFVAAVQRPLAWPVLPPISAEGDLALQARLSGAIEICAPGQAGRGVQTLVPTFASESIAAGLDLWIEAIHAMHGIRRWDVQQVDQDLVVLQLEVGEDAIHTSPIPLRAHQLGLDGIEALLAKVATLGSGNLTVKH